MTAPNFSSVAMRILSPDGKTVLAELQTIDRQAVGTARRAGDAVSAGINQVQQRTAIATRQIAGNVAQITAMGVASAESLKGIVSQGANIAFMFGTGGAIAGAIGVTGLAIFNLFSRTREQIEETARTAAIELKKLSRGGDIGAVAGRHGRATLLFSGEADAIRGEHDRDETERAFEARRKGIQGVRAEIERLEAVIARTAPKEGEIFGGERAIQFKDATDALKEWRAELVKLTAEYNQLVPLVDKLSKEAGEIATRVTAMTDAEKARALTAIAAARGLEGGRVPGVGVSAPNFSLPKFKIKPPDLSESIDASALQAAWLQDWDKLVAGIGPAMGQTLADGIANGITTAIQTGSIGKAFGAMTGTILSGLGDMAIQVGTKALAFAQIWARLQTWLTANPIAAIPVALGLIAFGAALKGVGASMSGRAGGFGGGGFSSGGGSLPPNTTFIGTVGTAPSMAQPQQPVNINNPVFLSPRDPGLQRQVAEVIKYAAQRGTV